MAGKANTACLCAILVLLAGGVAAQDPSTCGQAGQPCCCKATDWNSPRCCATALKCTMFAGAGFGTPAKIESLCLPTAEEVPCGQEGGRCCLGPSTLGFVSANCTAGLTCIPGPTAFGSRAQFDRLNKAASTATRDAAVSGTCTKATTCNTAYNPCGKEAGCGSAACPSGFYCADSFDSGVGDVCLPLPANAGQAGGPCLPNNLEGAPVVEGMRFAVPIQAAAPFCSGSAICFTPIGGDATGLNLGRAGEARELAARITGTKCVEVPADCGSAIGKTCCPSPLNMLTDKPLPSAAWGGDACGPKVGKYGSFCRGSYSVFDEEPLGKCGANLACGGPGQRCCRYSKGNNAGGGVQCPLLGGPGAGYCNLDRKCTLCPPVAHLVEDLIRCV